MASIQFRAEHEVKVFLHPDDVVSGRSSLTIRKIPLSFSGFDNYKFRDVVYKGYADQSGDPLKAYIILTEPLLP